MRKFSKLEIFNVVGLIFVAVLAFGLYRFATNPVPIDLEHNLKLEASDLNEKMAGSIILGSIRVEKSEVSGSKIIIRLRETEKNYDRKYVFDSLRGRFCVAVLNGYDSDSHRSSIEFRLYDLVGEKYEALQIDPEKCRSLGYRPVTG